MCKYSVYKIAKYIYLSVLFYLSTSKIEYFCTFTRVKLKKQYFYWSNILSYVSVFLLKYLVCVLRPPLVIGLIAQSD